MKVVVVEDPDKQQPGLNEILKGRNESIRVLASFEEINSSIEWLKNNEEPDFVLIREGNKLPEPGPVSLFSSTGATVVFDGPSGKYSYEAFRIGRGKKTAIHPSQQGIKWRNELPAFTTYRTRFLVKNGQKFASILARNIAYFYSSGRFIYFKTSNDQKLIVEYTLEELETMLDPAQFFRVNRSLLISFDSIQQISPYSGNRLKLVLHPGFEKDVIVSRDKSSDFKKWMGE